MAELIEREELSDVTLVGHGWGGYVITGAVPKVAGRLRKVVYWSAFVPAEGKGLVDEIPPDHGAGFRQLAEASGNNTVTLPFEPWQRTFMQDAPEAVQRMVWSLLAPQPFQYFTETVQPLDVRLVPVAYVLSVDDIVVPPGEYQWSRFAERLGVEPINAPGGHEALLTRPEGLAKALLEA